MLLSTYHALGNFVVDTKETITRPHDENIVKTLIQVNVMHSNPDEYVLNLGH